MRDIPSNTSASFRRLNPHLYPPEPKAPPRDDLALESDPPKTTEKPRGVSDELALHDDIIKYCRAQWPQWKYIHANPTQPSCIQVGAPDFPIIYLPGGKFIILEVKTETGKLSDDQRIFSKELEMLGHKVTVVRSMEDVVAAIKAVQPESKS